MPVVVAVVVVSAGFGGWTGAFDSALAWAPVGNRLAAIGDSLSDPLRYFADRSPGARGHRALYQSKQRIAPNRLADARPAPFERVLSNVRQAPPAGPGETPLLDLLSAPGPLSGTFDPGLLPDAGLTPAGTAAAPLRTASLFPAAPLLAPAGGGAPGGAAPAPGPGVIGPDANIPDATVPGASAGAVPEPAGWLTMIVGMAIVSGALRAKARRGASACPAPGDA
ncbi:MAG: hypothetical protein KGM17_03705 [Sphingomonadales bacterium]|nr:hypothetical protein [Sphingomonadales bacterium]